MIAKCRENPMSREDEWLDAIDLTRKQETEIERLRAENDRLRDIARRALEETK